MSDMMTWMLAALVGELVLLLLVLLTVSWARNRAARRRDAKAMQSLVGRIRNTRAEREATLTRVLSDNFGLEDDALGTTASVLLRHEISMLQRFVGIYGSRDAGAAALFDADIVAAIAPYHGLAGGSGSAPPLADDDRIDPADFEALQQENKRLSDELRITMETMSRMLNEYSTMFSGAPADGAAPIAVPTRASEGSETLAGAETETPAEALVRGAEESADDDGVTVVFEEAEQAAEEPALQPEGSGHGSMEDAEKASIAEAMPHRQEFGELASADQRFVEPSVAAADDRPVAAVAVEHEVDIAVEPDESASTPLPDEVSNDKETTAQDGSERGDAESVFAGFAEPAAVDAKEPALAVGEENDGVEASAEVSAESLFDQEPEETDIALQDKGADIEVMSDLLVEAESALVAADGSGIGTDAEAAPLLDAEDDGLFDAVDVQRDAPVSDSGVVAEAEIDSLFDTDEPADLGREKSNQG